MSPACGHLSLFRGKRSVLVSLEVFRRRRGRPAAFWPRCLFVPGPLGSPPSGSPRPRTPGSGAPEVRRLPAGAHYLGLRCRPPGLAGPLPAVPGSAWPCSRQPPRCPGPSVRARLPAGSGGRRACPGRPGCGPPGQPANMTLVSVNGSQSRPGPAAKSRTGWRCTVAYRLRSVTSPGKRAGRASRPPLISLRCSQFVTHLKHIPAAVTLPGICL